MEIKKSGSQASTKGLADWFTGTVRIDPLFEAREYVVAGDRRIDREAAGEAASDRAITSQPADVRGVSVTFELATRRVRPTADRVLAPPGIHIHSARH
jgi:hypothetical protein